jgi:hypothetical protein
MLHRRENVNDRLQNIFQFMALQRARVPASRDAVESVLAVTIKTCRFGYEAVIAHSAGQEAMIIEHAAVSPVHQAVQLPVSQGGATLHRYVFVHRTPKPKWRGD